MKQTLQTLALYCLLGMIHAGMLNAQQADKHAKIDSLLHAGINNLNEEELTNNLTLCREYLRLFGEEQNPEIKKRLTDILIYISRLQRRIGSQSSHDAITELLPAWERDQNNPALNRELGLHYKNIDRFTEARKYLEKAANSLKKDIEVLSALVDLNDEKGDVHQKIAAYQSYLAVDSLDAETWMKLGKAHLSLEHEREAEKFFKQAIRFDPSHMEARQALTTIQVRKGEIDEAATNLKAILNSGNVPLGEQSTIVELKHQFEKKQLVMEYLRKGISLLNSKNPDKWRSSITEFRNALLQEPENEEARQGIGSARKKLCNHYYSSGTEQERTGNSQLAYEFYTSSLLYAESDEDRDRAFKKQKFTAIKVGIFSGALNARAAADSALNDKRFREALTKYVAAELLNPNLREQLSSKRSAAEVGENYERGMLAWVSKDYEAAKIYLKLVMQVKPNFEDVQYYFAIASKLHKIEEEILFLKEQATLDSNMLGRKKIVLEKLLPRIDAFIAYFDTLMQSVTNKLQEPEIQFAFFEQDHPQRATLLRHKEALLNEQKSIAKKIELLTKEKKRFDDALRDVNQKLSDRDTQATIETLGIFVTLTIIGFGSHKGITRLYPIIRKPAKQELKNFFVAVGASSGIYELMDNFLSTIHWKQRIVIGLFSLCVLYYIIRIIIVYRNMKQAGKD